MILMTDLLRRKAVAQGQRFPVSELFFDAARGALHYVALRTGGFFNREEVLLSIRAFERPEPGRDGWPVALDAEAVAAAPVWTEGTSAAGPLSLAFWPPIVVGPFGNTESPLMLWAQAAAAADRARGSAGGSERPGSSPTEPRGGARGAGSADQVSGRQAADEAAGSPTSLDAQNGAGAGFEAAPPVAGEASATASPAASQPIAAGGAASGRPIGDGRVYRLERVRRRLGAEVFGSDGPLGHLADLTVDTDEFRIDGLVVITDRARHRVPYGALRHMASEGDHLVLALDASGLAAMPPAHAAVP